MLRGDTAMWVLTKMAMLFFIAALAAILVVFTSYERTGLCNEEARAISSTVAGSLTQLLNTPLEDERRTLKLEPSLSIGEGRRARYSMHITRRTIPSQDYDALIVSVVSELDPKCNAGVQVTYSNSFDAAGDKRLFFIPASNDPFRYSTSSNNNAREVLTIRPSVLNPAKEGPRSTFVTIIKCTQKRTAQKKYFFIQDCTQSDASACINLDSGDSASGAPGSIEQLCGF